MSNIAKPLSLSDCFTIINKWAWISDDPNNLCYPMFLYLNFCFIDNESIYIKINDLINKFFSKYLIDKKYSFSGRNGTFPISKAKMKDCLGKIIIITNTYPTKTLLDELINSSTNDLNHDFNLNIYKDTYITYNDIGLSQDYNRNDLVNSCKTNLNFFYALPNVAYKNNYQSKAGQYNPSFQDCAQYGVQGSLMYLFVPDDNLNKWYLFFKNKNNQDPVLKEEMLRLVITKDIVIQEQNPIIGLQMPQKYCVVPGLISTNKSNLSTNSTNLTCE